MSVRIYVGNLPEEIERQELEVVFNGVEPAIQSLKLVTNRKTGKCRGFGFITVKTAEEAEALVAQFNGYAFRDAALKVEIALPRAKGEEGDGPETEAAAPEQVTPAPTPKVREKGAANTKKARPAGRPQDDRASSVEPDPRWAQELQKLKDMLLAQTTGS